MPVLRHSKYQKLMLAIAAVGVLVTVVGLVWEMSHPQRVLYEDRTLPSTSVPPVAVADSTTTPAGQQAVATESRGDYAEFSVAAGATAALDPGVAWVCSGDVVVNGTPQYDADETTGLVTVVPRGAGPEILAPWGASCHPASEENLSAVVDQAATYTRESGCNGGCVSVVVAELH